MSSIKSTQFDGDVSIGRNLSLGGLFTVQGPSIMKGNVRIDGWLDAKNIKGANKGIFTTAEKLLKAYPRPHDGWWAIVGTSLPGPIYVGEGGEWVATGETGGNPTLDGDLYVKAIEDLRQDLEEHITLYDSHFDKEGNLTAEKIIANGPLVCVSNFARNSVTTTAGLESFRIGSSTNPNYGWGTYIWSYDNGHGFIQQSAQRGETFPLNIQPFGGNVGINWGNNSSAQYTLDVNGAIRSTREIIARSIDINEVFEADTLSATINSIDVFEVNSGTVLLNSNVDITGNATIGGTLDVTGGVTADALTIGEVLISYDNRILGPEISANVLIVNGKTVFTDEIEVSEHVTIDRQGYITGVMYTGEVDCTGYTQTEGVFVVQSTEPMELDTNVNIYQGLNVTNNATVGGKLSANVLIVNGKTVFTDEMKVSEHVTIDRQGYITGVMYTGEVDCTGYTQTEGIFVVQSTEPMELDTNVNIYQGLNVTNNATVGGKLSVTGLIQSYETVSAGKGLIAYGGGLQIYSGGIDCKGGDVQIADSLCIKEKESYEYVQVLSIPEDSPVIYIGNFEDLDKGNYTGIALWGETSIHGNLNASSATIDTSLVVNGPLSLGNYAAFSNDFINLGDDTVSDLNIQAVNVNIEATNFNVDSSIAVTGETVLQDLSVLGSAMFNSGFWSIGRSSFEYPIYMNCEMSESYPGIYMQELQEYEHIRVIGFSGDAAGNEYIDIGEEQHADSQKYYRGIRLNGAINTVKGSLRVEESFTSLGDFSLGDVIYYTTGDDRVDFSTDILLQIVDGLNGREMEHGAIKSYSFGCFDYIRLLGLTKNAFSTDSIPSLEIGSAEDYAKDGYSGIKLFGDTQIEGKLEARSGVVLGPSMITVDASMAKVTISGQTVRFDTSIDARGSDISARNLALYGNIHLGFHSVTALGIHTSLTTEHADTGMLVHLIGLQDIPNGMCVLSIGSKSYASATAPDAIALVTSYESGNIELIGNVYIPQKLKLGGATFTYDAINDCIVCDKRIANAGAGK